MALRGDHSIEQMLTATLSERTLSWCSVHPAGEGFALKLHHVHDDGNDEFLDVYEFRSVTEEEAAGEGRLLGEYPDAASALKAAGVIGARADRWVNAGVIRDEYADLRQA